MIRKGLFLLLLQFVMGQETYVTTIFPFAMILEEITGTQVSCLVGSGDSPHTYSLRPSRVKETQRADLFFYGQAQLDGWAAVLPAKHIIVLYDLLPVEYRLYIKSYYGKSRDKIVSEDPHFWTDPLTVNALLPVLVDTLCRALPSKCTVFKKNEADFSGKLQKLHADLQQQLAPLSKKSVLLAHPFFQYYLKRYNIALAGIIEPIPGNEPTALEISDIIKSVKEQNVTAILVNEQHSDRSARLISESTGIPLIMLDPIGGNAGRRSYFELLQYNTQQILQVIK
jgi:zinc transport system substrate-binding protein